MNMPSNIIRTALLPALATVATGQSQLWSTAESSGQRYGLCVSAVGDVDGDGVVDVVVGAPDSDLGAPNAGAVAVLSGATGAVLYAVPGLGAGDSLGFCVAGLGGDVDGDGVSDFVAGARFSDLGGPNFGAAHVISGATGAIVFSVVGTVSGGRFGEAVGAAGDVNGDGVPDVIVGARLDTTSGATTGAARVYSGVGGTLLFELLGDNSADFFGRSVGTVGDIDLDGYDDFFVGAPGDDDAGSLSGSVRVFSGFDATELRRFDGDAALDQLGGKASTIGDVDGDGIPEFAIGMIGSDFGLLDGGAVRVYDGATGAVRFTLAGNSIGAEFGSAVSAAGDVNGDGIPDVLAGARLDDDAMGVSVGSAGVYSGLDGQLIWSVFGPSELSQFGDTCAPLGDTNGDGFDDVLVGAFGDDLVLVFSGRDVIGQTICGPAVPNSTGEPARLTATGSAVAAQNDVRLTVTNLPPQQFGIFLTSPEAIVVANPGGVAGTLCIGSFEIGRYPFVFQTGPGGAVSLDLDLTLTPTPNSVVPVLAGETRYWQYWYRDVPNTANFSDAVEITFE